MRLVLSTALFVLLSGPVLANAEADQAIKSCKSKVKPTRAEGGKGNEYTANYDYVECLKGKIAGASKDLLPGSAQATFLAEADKVADQIVQVYAPLEEVMEKVGARKALDQLTDASVIPFYEGLTQAAFEAAKVAKEAGKK